MKKSKKIKDSQKTIPFFNGKELRDAMRQHVFEALIERCKK
jgi:hypothetical protein